MACRVGMTTNLVGRKRYWEGQHPLTLANWRVLETHHTKTAAQAAEIRLANAHGCIYGPGGDGPEHAVWYVYYFTH
ncbi:MAG: hypothetical protein OXF01_03905 [Gemmatimonadetes bacterium]|nr:hypothetical protein [Gemmatimonadota bacterium]